MDQASALKRKRVRNSGGASPVAGPSRPSTSRAASEMATTRTDAGGDPNDDDGDECVFVPNAPVPTFDVSSDEEPRYNASPRDGPSRLDHRPASRVSPESPAPKLPALLRMKFRDAFTFVKLELFVHQSLKTAFRESGRYVEFERVGSTREIYVRGHLHGRKHDGSLETMSPLHERCWDLDFECTDDDGLPPPEIVPIHVPWDGLDDDVEPSTSRAAAAATAAAAELDANRRMMDAAGGGAYEGGAFGPGPFGAGILNAVDPVLDAVLDSALDVADANAHPSTAAVKLE